MQEIHPTLPRYGTDLLQAPIPALRQSDCHCWKIDEKSNCATSASELTQDTEVAHCHRDQMRAMFHV